MEHKQKILSVSPVTHDVYCIRIEKPAGYYFEPGQATEVSISKPGWENEKRPFTFTAMQDDPYLEFTIKSYNDHKGVTDEISRLVAGDALIIDDAWGSIAYKGAGYFIAGGAGITPFIAILRQLHKAGKLAGNKLFFSNKTPQDIIYEAELRSMLGDDAVFITTVAQDNDHLHGFINEAFLQAHVQSFEQHFYICGPDPMIKSISDILVSKGAKPEAVVFEK